MANHVYFYATAHGKVDALKAVYEKLLPMKTNIDSTTEADPTDVIKDLYGITEEVEETYSFFVEHVGAKWCHIEDIDIYYEEGDEEGQLSFSGYSAWSPPDALLAQVYKLIYEQDNDAVMSMHHDDEAYNFVGAYQYVAGEAHEWYMENDDLIAQGFLAREDPEDEDSYLEMNWDMLEEERERWSDRIISANTTD